MLIFSIQLKAVATAKANADFLGVNSFTFFMSYPSYKGVFTRPELVSIG
ncbi:MAG: hypothetical protein MK096_14310 [Oleiphilaceae bacterium]|nr:hypothetical protein [Oleiphilaceae bacterium]